MNFTAEQVWAAAAAADRINGGYVKEDVYVMENQCRKLLTEANKVMVKRWLREGYFSDIEPEDYEAGQRYRDYFKTFTLKALAGRLNDFEHTAMKIATMDEFTGRNLLEFAVISCLPSVARRDQQRMDLQREVYASVPLAGNQGDTVIGDVEVVNCNYNQNYNKFKVNARMGDSFVHFWYKDRIEGSVRIRAKIKDIRGDKTTALNYVKIIG